MSKFKREWRRQQREAWREHLRRHGIEPEGDDMPRCSRPRERGPFRRYPERGIAAGVVAGLARWLGWSTWAVRGPAIALLVINPPFFLAAYLTLWALMEREAVFGWIQGLFPRLPDAVPQSRVDDVRARLRGLETRAARLEERVTSEAFGVKGRFRHLDGT